MARRRDLTTIQVKKSILKPLDEIAERMGVSRSVVVRWAIEGFVASCLDDGSTIPTVEIVQRRAQQYPVEAKEVADAAA